MFGHNRIMSKQCRRCPCNGTVGTADLHMLLELWGMCSEPKYLHADWMSRPAGLNGDGVVDGTDLLILLAKWGYAAQLHADPGGARIGISTARFAARVYH